MNDLPNRDVVIFTEAVQLPAGGRAAYLAGACAGDAELRQRVEALLHTHDHIGDFLEASPQQASIEARMKNSTGEREGDRIGRYKLLQQIGEGGWGVVFMAEQEEPVRRRVALKIVKPGMDTKNVIARFEAERQALALMDHPNIAHVLDAGATENGRPYFVMELVRGARITDYCDQNNLPTADRLELFIQVCNAVQHAHQKGVIHRDIKPSNILVTTSEDGKPLPKVIDFGIAKATTGVRLTDKTLFTAFEMLIGTPAYMSPEQAAQTSLDVDTRTDIYSLGVLLYELLTSTTPFDTRELLKAGLDEVRRVVQTEEPVCPSTRLSTMMAANLASVSRQRQAGASKLISDVRGDLDWIVMKALEKDRGRRYQTANALAEDIQRYAENEPVSARAPGVAYRFQKLFARHTLGFVAFGIVLATLVAGLAITTWSLNKEKRAHHETDLARLEANEQRQKAELDEGNALTEAARSRQVTKLLERTLAGVDPEVALGRDTTLLREILDKAVKDMDLELTNQPSVLADLRMKIGGVYRSLMQADKAERLIREALAFYRESPEGSGQRISEALSSLSVLHVRQPGKVGQAEQEAREALDWETKTQGGLTLRIIELRCQLAWALLARGKAADAENVFREALVDEKGLVGYQLLDTRAGLATALKFEDKFDESEKILRESLSIGRERLGPDHPYVADDLFRLGSVLEREHKFEEAEKCYRQCLDLRRKMLGKNHPLSDDAVTSLSNVLINEGRITEAADVYGQLLDARRQRLGDQDSTVIQTADTVVRLLTVAGNDAQFEQLARQFPEAWTSRANALARLHRWSEALAAASKVVDLRPADPDGYHLKAPLLAQLRDRRAYEELCVQITTRFAGTTDPYTADRMAKDCLILPRPGADIKVPGELAEIAVNKGGNDPNALPFFLCCKGLAEYRQGHYDEAVKWARLASANAFPYSRAEAFAILGMSQYRLNQVDTARTNLANCEKVVLTQLPRLETGDLGGDWRDWIIAHALLTEARDLLGAAPARPDSSHPKNE